MTSKSKKQGKKRRAEDVAESESDSSADEQDLEAFHRRMNEDADQEAGGRWAQKYKNTLLQRPLMLFLKRGPFGNISTQSRSDRASMEPLC